MKLGICNEMFEQPVSRRTFALIREIGFTGVEIAPFTLCPGTEPFHIHNVDTKAIEAVTEHARATELKVVGLHWLLAKTEGLHLTSPNPSVRRTTSAYLTALAECCAAIGGEVMVLGSPSQRNLLPGVTHNEAEKYAADVLTSAMPRCEELKITIAIEPLGPAEGDFLNTAESAIALVKRVGSASCQLHLDVKAMSTEQASIPEIISASQEWLAHFHANEPNLLGPGMGDTDFRPILRQLLTIGYQGWITVEPFRYEPSPEGVARQSFANLQAAL